MEEKTTNVNPSDLNYTSYDVEKYDKDIVNSIPGHEQLHQVIASELHAYANRPVKVLELGIGTGLTAQILFESVSQAILTAVDFSASMIAGAKKRLLGKNVNFVEGDYSQLTFDNDYEIVLSVIGIHHQTDEGKRLLFEKIHSSLQQGGVFIFGDLVTYKDLGKAKQANDAHYAHLESKAADKETFIQWKHHHERLNLLAPVEDQIEWLKEAGFTSVEVLFELYNTVLLVARK